MLSQQFRLSLWDVQVVLFIANPMSGKEIVTVVKLYEVYHWGMLTQHDHFS